MKKFLTLGGFLFVQLCVFAQPFTRQDTLRGSITPERAWWDLSYYDPAIDVDVEGKSLKGTNTIYFFVIIPQQVIMDFLILQIAVTGKKCLHIQESKKNIFQS